MNTETHPPRKTGVCIMKKRTASKRSTGIPMRQKSQNAIKNTVVFPRKESASTSLVKRKFSTFNIQIQANPRSCTLTWNLEASKCSENYYVLEVLRYKHLLSWESLYEITTRDNSASVRDLHVGKKYRFRITPIKIDGTRGHGFCSRTIIPMAVRPPTVSRFTENDTDRYFNLTWSPPDAVPGHLIRGYFVEQTLVGSSFGWIRLNDSVLKCTEYAVSDLEPGKWYKYRIVVVKAETEYCGVETVEVRAMKPPLRPTQPAVYDITSQSCVLEWTAPDFDGGSPISGYVVEIKQSDMQWETFCSVSADDQSTAIGNLVANETYSFRIRAVNDAGHGENSLESEAIKATGIDFSDNYSLVRMKPASLERKGMKSLTNSFEIGVSYFIKLMESLHKLTSSVTYKEADVINKDIWLYSERLHFHMRHTFEKIEAVSSEIKRRMEAVIYEIGEKEQEQRRNKIRSRTLEQQIRALQTELEELRKEKIEADLKYERVKRNLRKAEKKLEEAKDKQDTYKAIGKACLFVPITGWLVSAVTLPIAFTVLQDNVDAAKYTADTEYRYKCDKEQQADSKASEIHKTVDVREVPAVMCGHDGTKAIVEIHSLSQDISSYSHDDEEMILTEYVNCSGFLGSAPATNVLIGQLLLISLKHDFAMDERQPVGGFKYLNQPKSFRVSMFQTANAATDAFLLAHRNMDQIKLYSKTIPTHLTKALKMLESGSSQEICRLLGSPLSLIKETSQKCLLLAEAVQWKFGDVVLLMDELQEACVSTKSQTDKKQEENKAMLIEVEEENELMENKKRLCKDQVKRKHASLQHEQSMFEKAKSKDVSKGIFEGIAYKVSSKVFGPSPSKKQKKHEDSKEDRSDETIDEKASASLEQNMDVDFAEILFEDAMSLEKNTKTLHTALDSMSDRNISLDVKTCKAKYERIKRRHCHISEEHSQIKQLLFLSEKGISLCGDVIRTSEKMNTENQQHLETKDAVLQFYKECDLSVEHIRILKGNLERKWASDLERKLNSATSINSNEKETGNYDLDQVKYKVGTTYKRMMKSAAEHERASKKLRRTRTELSNIVSEIAGLEMKTLDLDQIVDLLCRCIKELGSLKDEWGKMVKLFQSITNIIDTTLNDSLKSFVDVSKTTKFDKPEIFRLSGQKRQLLYDKVIKASEVAYFIEHFTESYTEVSEKFFLPVLEALPLLLKCTGMRNPQIKEKLKQLQNESIAAQTGINDHLELKQKHFQSTVKARIATLKRVLNKRIPKIENSCTNTLDPDDFA